MTEKSPSPSPNEIRSRLAAPGDQEAVHALLTRYRAEVAVVESPNLPFPVEGDGTRFVVIAEREGDLVGMVLAQKGVSLLHGTLHLHLSDIFVLPEHRERGVAKTIMVEVEALARRLGCDEMRLFVEHINHAALVTASRTGFSQRHELLLSRTV